MSDTVSYSVTVADWTERRGYRNSGRGWRVRCFCIPDNDWNALGRTVAEQFFRTEAAARKEAASLAKQYNATLFG